MKELEELTDEEMWERLNSATLAEIERTIAERNKYKTEVT